jgi:hypothetical protein
VKIDDSIGRYVDDIFYHYDMNEDKNLDRNESRNFFNDATDNTRIDEKEHQEWFGLIDANKDGNL